MQKSKAVKIVLDRAEGMIHECGEVTFEGPDCWEKANRQLLHWSHTAPKSGGYNKCDFTVWFEDGEDYKGRFDLYHYSCEHFEWSLADHIAQFVTLHMGGWCPSHLTEERYQKYLLQFNRGGVVDAACLAVWRKIWENYEIPSPWANGRNFADLMASTAAFVAANRCA